MQTKRNKLDYGMTLLSSLEQLVPLDHHLLRLDKVLDLSFIHESLRDKYCQNNGRPSIDPAGVARTFVRVLINFMRKYENSLSAINGFAEMSGYRTKESDSCLSRLKGGPPGRKDTWLTWPFVSCM